VAYPSSPAGYSAEPPGYAAPPPPPPPPRGADPYARGNDYAPAAPEYPERGYAGGYAIGEPRQYDDGYGQPAPSHGAPASYGRSGYDAGYEGGGYSQPANYGAPAGYGQSGYDAAEGYGANGGYDARGGANGYAAPRAGYEDGYERAPEQRNGYDARGYDQDGYYEEPAGRRPAQPRGERRSLDWLDD
jgi:hypothetical protein